MFPSLSHSSDSLVVDKCHDSSFSSILGTRREIHTGNIEAKRFLLRHSTSIQLWNINLDGKELGKGTFFSLFIYETLLVYFTCSLGFSSAHSSAIALSSETLRVIFPIDSMTLSSLVYAYPSLSRSKRQERPHERKREMNKIKNISCSNS